MNQYQRFSKLLIFLYLLSYASALHHAIFIKHQYCFTHEHLIHTEPAKLNPYPISEKGSKPKTEDPEKNCFTWQLFSKSIAIFICVLLFLFSRHRFFSFSKINISFLPKAILSLAPKNSPPIFYPL